MKSHTTAFDGQQVCLQFTPECPADEKLLTTLRLGRPLLVADHLGLMKCAEAALVGASGPNYTLREYWGPSGAYFAFNVLPVSVK